MLNDNLYLKGAFRWPNAENSLLSSTQQLCLRRTLTSGNSQAELCQRHSLSENQVSTWKRQFLEHAETFFESETEKPSSESAERIAQLEQLVGRLTLETLEIPKKASTFLD